MEEAIEQAAERAISTMRENLGEPLTVDDMARAAMFSKFHFTRIFQRATGLSPGRFLSALRLQRAKHLLVSTSLNVADISLKVGYNSVGTFSSRFSRSVGMSPTAYRRLAGFAPQIATDPSYRANHACTARVHGHVQLSQPADRRLVFIGLFPDRIPEGRPVRCTILSGPGPFDFEAVPTGTWFLLAQSVAEDPRTPATAHGTDHTVSVASHGPLTIHKDSVVRADLTLNPARSLDPPVLLALLDARRVALATVAAGQSSGTAQPDGRIAHARTAA